MNLLVKQVKANNKKKEEKKELATDAVAVGEGGS
jgi:hypothetical protein